MLSNYSGLLPKMSCFILGLSRGSSVVAGWAALEAGLLPGLRAGRLWHGMWVPPVDQQAGQTNCRTPQAGPRLREVPTQGKILGDWVGHRVWETQVGGWRDCNIQEGVRTDVICPDSLKLKRREKRLSEPFLGKGVMNGRDKCWRWRQVYWRVIERHEKMWAKLMRTMQLDQGRGKELDKQDRLFPSEHASAETQSKNQDAFLSSTWRGRGKPVSG